MTKVEEAIDELFTYADHDLWSGLKADIDTLVAAVREEERKRIFDAGVVTMADVETNPHKVFTVDATKVLCYDSGHDVLRSLLPEEKP